MSAVQISPRFTTDDWRRLHLQRPRDWLKAVAILDDRIRGRFLTHIETLQDHDFSGFAVLALDCLLIETLQQFREGVHGTPRGDGKAYFQRFLTQTCFSAHFDDATSETFYDHFRCGILHQAETKEESKIWRVGPVVTRLSNGTGLRINRRKFHSILRKAFSDYLRVLRNRSDVDLAGNFVRKMNAICGM